MKGFKIRRLNPPLCPNVVIFQPFVLKEDQIPHLRPCVRWRLQANMLACCHLLLAAEAGEAPASLSDVKNREHQGELATLLWAVRHLPCLVSIKQLTSTWWQTWRQNSSSWLFASFNGRFKPKPGWKRTFWERAFAPIFILQVVGGITQISQTCLCGVPVITQPRHRVSAVYPKGQPGLHLKT